MVMYLIFELTGHLVVVVDVQHNALVQIFGDRVVALYSDFLEQQKHEQQQTKHPNVENQQIFAHENFHFAELGQLHSVGKQLVRVLLVVQFDREHFLVVGSEQVHFDVEVRFSAEHFSQLLFDIIVKQRNFFQSPHSTQIPV